MNVLAGILLGFFNSYWINILIMSFIWGVIYYFYRVSKGKQRDFLAWHSANHADKKYPRLKFFFIEFMTAVSTSLAIGTAIHWGKSFFK